MVSRMVGLVRRIGSIVFVVLLIPLLPACSEPRAVDVAKLECIEFAIEDAQEAFEKGQDRSEDILDACLDAAGDDPAKEQACRDAHTKRLEEYDLLAKKIEAAKRQECDKFFADQAKVNEWLEGDNEKRAEIKKELIKALQAVATTLIDAIASYTGAALPHQIEQGAINDLTVASLIPPGSTALVMTTGLGAGIPDPVQPVSITFTLDAAHSGATVSFTMTQAITLTGSYTLLFTPNAAQPGRMTLDLLDMGLSAGSLELGAVSTGLQQVTPDPYAPAGSGSYDRYSGQVQLFVPVVVDNDLLPPTTAAVGLPLTGFLQTNGQISLLTLGWNGPLGQLFQFKEPPSPLAASALVGPGGGQLALDSLTHLVLPPGALPGALATEVTVTLAYTPQELLPDPCALPAEPGDLPHTVRCIALAFDTGPGGLSLTSPATLTLFYNGGLFTNMAVERAMPYAYSPEDRQWTPIVSYTHDMSSQVMGFPLTQFGRYGLGAPRRYRQFLPVVLKNR